MSHDPTERAPTMVRQVAATRLPTELGEFRCLAFDDADGETHLVLTMGDVTAAPATDPADAGDAVLVRLHSECMTGDVFGSRRCDCGPQLQLAMGLVAEAGRGIVVYLTGHEGRGIGIAQKLRAYELQDGGLDTVDANLELGLPVDRREYAIGAEILRQLGVARVRLLTNNPAKAQGLTASGIEVVDLVPVITEVHADNEVYLRTKRRRLGHSL